MTLIDYETEREKKEQERISTIDLEELFEELRTSGKQSITIEGKDFRIPKPYFLKNNQLWKIEVKTEGRGENKVEKNEEVFVSRHAPVITETFQDVETNEFFLKINWIEGKRIFEQVVNGYEIAAYSEIVKLAKYSLAINSTNGRNMIVFLDQQQNYNTIPKEKIVQRLGMIKGEFIHPLTTKHKILPADQGEAQIIESFKANGSSQEWIDNVLELIKPYPRAMVPVLASFASIMLKDFNLKPIFVDLSGQTSLGKTSVLHVCASVYGTDELIGEFNLTPTSAERKGSLLNQFPLILDDSKKMRKELVEDLVYIYSGGRGRGRGTVRGTQVETFWNNFAIVTGENRLADHSENAAGIEARILHIIGSPFEGVDYKFFNKLYQGVGTYYGTMGIDFIKKWQAHKKDEFEVYDAFNAQLQQFAKSNPVFSRLSRHYALIMHVADFLNRHFKTGINLDSLIELFQLMCEENKSADKPKELMERMLFDLDSNRRMIYYKYEPTSEMHAIFKNKDLYIMPKYLKTFLGVEYNAIKKEWIRRGYIVTKDNGETLQAIWKRPQTHRTYQIDTNIISELGFNFLESDIEPNFLHDLT